MEVNETRPDRQTDRQTDRQIKVEGGEGMINRSGYRISPRGRRPVMNWCLSAIE